VSWISAQYWTAARDRTLRKLADARRSPEEIAKQLGCDVEAVKERAGEIAIAELLALAGETKTKRVRRKRGSRTGRGMSGKSDSHS